MLRNERLKLLVMMALHLMWGVILWFSISKYGLGVSTDAVHLLFGGQNLAAGNGLTSYDGTFIPFWPPLYPALLGLVRLVTGVDVLIAALVVQTIAFLGLGLSLSMLFLRAFSGRVVPSAAALILTQAGAVVVTAAGTVGADYVHLFLVALLVFLAARYVESGSRNDFAGLAVVAMLVTLVRYLGVAATATAIAAIVLLSRANWRHRLGDAAVLGLTALPMAVWLAATSLLYARRGPITFGENLAWFSHSVLEWFVGPVPRKGDLATETAILWLLVAALAATTVFLGRRGQDKNQAAPAAEASGHQPWPYMAVLLLYGLIYALVLFGSAAIAYFNKLGGRFILPLYIPMLALPVIVADRIVQAARRSERKWLTAVAMVSVAVPILLVGIAVMRTAYPLVMESHARGVAGGDNAFNNESWRENAALLFWKEHPPTGDFLLFSNEPDGTAFHTRRPVEPAPRRVSGPYGTEVMPVADFKDELFASGQDVYLMWIEPSSYDYFYAPQELEEIAAMEVLFSSDMGTLYRLSPRGEG